LKQRGFPAADIGRKVSQAAEILGLTDYLERKPRALSGGQRQRVAMGRAIVRDPNVFLFDEPLSNLDAKLRVQMRSELKELHQRLSTTTIYVTHDQIEAMTLADRVVVMNGGHVEQVGPPLELYDDPKSLFVAAFIGSPQMNFFEGVLNDRDALVLPNGHALALGKRVAPAGTEVTIGVRPEHLMLGDAGWQSQTIVIEPTGSETQITTRIAGNTVRILLKGRTTIAPGQTIHLAAEPDNIHAFARKTGEALSS